MFLTMVHVEAISWDTLLERTHAGPEWSTAGGWWLPVGAAANSLSIDTAFERGEMTYWETDYVAFEP